MQSSCFIVPVHPPKYDYAVKLLESYNKYFGDDHIFFVFSSNEDVEAFKIRVPNLKYRSLVYSGSLESNGIINRKKFYALGEVFRQGEFDKVAAIDSDSLFLSNADYDKLFSEHIVNKKIYGNMLHQGFWVQHILKEPIRFFNAADSYHLDAITKNFQLYFWFNDIPVYDKEYFQEFLEYVSYSEIENQICNPCFDYIFYAYFLLIKGYAELIDLNCPSQNSSFLEQQSNIPTELFSQLFHSYEPMWIKNEIADMKNVFVKMHVDRV